MELQQILEILEHVATSYPNDATEKIAIEKACYALLFTQRQEARDQFKQFVTEIDRPLNGIELIRLKAYGLNLPDEQKTPDILGLELEIDSLADKINKLGRRST